MPSPAHDHDSARLELRLKDLPGTGRLVGQYLAALELVGVAAVQSPIDEGRQALLAARFLADEALTFAEILAGNLREVIELLERDVAS